MSRKKQRNTTKPARTAYAVRTLPVRDETGAILGWVRADMFADGSQPTDMIFLRDGSACGQAVAMQRVQRDLSLLFATQDEAARDGFAQIRAAEERGDLRTLRA